MDNIFLQTNLVESHLTHYVAIYMTIMYYLNKPHNLLKLGN